MTIGPHLLLYIGDEIAGADAWWCERYGVEGTERQSAGTEVEIEGRNREFRS